MALMHPVDWFEVNRNQGIQQDLPVDESHQWFDNDLSFLKTPQDRKSRPIIPPLLEDSRVEGDYVVHNVQTEVTFEMGALLAFAQQRSALLNALSELSEDEIVAETPMVAADISVPFSSIKKNSLSRRSLAKSKRSLFRVPTAERFSLDDDELDEETENFEPVAL